MSRVAYSLRKAAEQVSLDENELILAVQAGHLTARRVNGRLLILRCDLKAWAKTHPNYLLTIG